MPDEEEQQEGAETPAAEEPAEAVAGEGDAGSGEEDQEAMMAEWEAMAAEGETDDVAAAGGAAEDSSKIPAINDVDLEAYAILGTSSMPVSQLLRMGRGAVVELDTGLGDQIEVKIHDTLVARGEVVVVDDRIAIEITEIVKREGQ